MKAIAVLCFAILLLTPNCGSDDVDTSRDFVLVMNGQLLHHELAGAIAWLHEAETEEELIPYTCSIIYPFSTFRGVMNRGLILTFDPNVTDTGRVLTVAAGNSGPKLDYYPMVGHEPSKNLTLCASSDYKSGKLEVRFDEIDPVFGGRVKGKIVHAVLYGYYKSVSTGEIKSSGSDKVEIYNFPFDTAFIYAEY